jgi:chloride channel protein, CIC family
VHQGELAIYAVLGLVGGFVSVLFGKLLIGMRTRFLQLPLKTRWFQPVAGGLLVGLLGWRVPEVLGVGYVYVGHILNGQMAVKVMVLLIVFKILAVTMSYSSGNTGGLFAPSLFIGALVGGIVGSAAHHLWPAYTALPGAYALVGMGALFAGIMRAPMTSVLMIFETTHDYAVIVPLMIANMVSFFISSSFQPVTVNDALAEQDGLHLPKAEIRRRRGQHVAMEVMRDASERLPADMTVLAAVERLRNSEFNAWPVTDEIGLYGVLSRIRLERAKVNGAEATDLNDLVDSRRFPHVHPDHPLDLVLERMGAARVDVLPVVSRANVHEMLGIVCLSDILGSFGIDRAKWADSA